MDSVTVSDGISVPLRNQVISLNDLHGLGHKAVVNSAIAADDDSRSHLCQSDIADSRSGERGICFLLDGLDTA